MKQWKKQHLGGALGVLIGISLVLKLGFGPALFIIVIVLVVVVLVVGLYELDQHYLDKGPQGD